MNPQALYYRSISAKLSPENKIKVNALKRYNKQEEGKKNPTHSSCRGRVEHLPTNPHSEQVFLTQYVPGFPFF